MIMLDKVQRRFTRMMTVFGAFHLLGEIRQAELIFPGAEEVEDHMEVGNR